MLRSPFVTVRLLSLTYPPAVLFSRLYLIDSDQGSPWKGRDDEQHGRLQAEPRPLGRLIPRSLTWYRPGDALTQFDDSPAILSLDVRYSVGDGREIKTNGTHDLVRAQVDQGRSNGKKASHEFFVVEGVPTFPREATILRYAFHPVQGFPRVGGMFLIASICSSEGRKASTHFPTAAEVRAVALLGRR
jgi:hypothetical protein